MELAITEPAKQASAKAWGASPRLAIIKSERSARSARQRCRPLTRAQGPIFTTILGLAPQALCLRLLRRLALISHDEVILQYQRVEARLAKGVDSVGRRENNWLLHIE